MSPDPSPSDQYPLRGFTLVELMVVVVIISILAALATPGIVARVTSYKTRSAAEQLASTYRMARLRAMGRGSAVVVRFNAGVVTVLEGIQGTAAGNAGCANLPASSCLTPATRFDTGSTLYQTVESYDALGGSSYAVSASFGTLGDLCFTPIGRAYSRTNLSTPFAPLLTPASLTVTSTEGGLARQVVVLPGGTARVIAGAL